MEKLITAAEVVDIAFGGAVNLRPSEVGDATIIAAQRKFILPVFGAAMTKALANGEHAAWSERFLKKPLALYVKFLLLPALAAQVGMAGVVKYSGEGFAAADAVTFRRLLRRIKSDADALLDSAVESVESAPASFPLYDARQNVRHRVSLEGNIVF